MTLWNVVFQSLVDYAFVGAAQQVSSSRVRVADVKECAYSARLFGFTSLFTLSLVRFCLKHAGLLSIY